MNKKFSIPLRNVFISPTFISVLAIVISLVFGAGIIALSNVSPIEAYKIMLDGAIGSTDGIAEVFVKVSPLLLTSIGVAIAFRTKVFNIGAEGQILMGAVGATFVGLFFGDLPPIIGIPIALIAGFIMGSLWGAVAGYFKIKYKASEIIVTLMMNYIAIEFVRFLINGPWQDVTTTEPHTRATSEGTWLPVLIPRTRLHFGIIIAFVAALVIWWVIRKTVLGYQINMTGKNKLAAEVNGIRVGKVIITSMLISGGLAGLAGASEIAGIHHRLLDGVSGGYGYLALTIAILGATHPLGVMLASVLFAGIVVGADKMHLSANVPLSVSMILQGLILIFVLVGEYFRNKFEKQSGKGV